MSQKNPHPHPGARSMLKAFLPALLMLSAYLFFWNAPKVHCADPWYDAFAKVKEAVATNDPGAKRRLLEDGGGELKELCGRFPFHARVHYFLGCYYAYVGEYDSAIVHAREAVRLGSGSTVSRVDEVAGELLSAATAETAAKSSNGTHANP